MPPIQAIIPVTPGSGLDLDAVSLTIGLNTVYREVLVIADPSNATYLATVTSGGALNVAEATLDGCITANVLAVSLPSAQITTLTPPTAAAIGTAVSGDLLIGTQLAAASVPVALPTATIITLTPPTAAAIAAAIVANPPTVAVSGTVGVTQSTSPWVVSCPTDIEVVQDTAADFNATVVGTGTFVVQASITTLGQQLAAASVPVVLTAAQISTLTPLTTVAVTQSTSPWIVAGGGTAGTAATGVVTVQGIAAMTPLLVTTTFSAPQHVIIDSGTITTVSTVTAVTAITNALPAGTNVIGHVITDSGSVTNATLSAETTKVIGVTRTADGAGNLLTSNSTTPAAHFALDSNITSILGTAPTTAGFLDIKGADGNVFVRQTTGTNLHVVTDSTSTTAVTQATASSLNATVVGTKTDNNAASDGNNIGALTAVANAVAPTRTEGDQVLLSVDINGGQRTIGGNIPEITAAWTSATAGNTALTQTVTGYSTVVVTFNQTSTLTGGVATFEVSDANTNWYTIAGAKTNAGGNGFTYTFVPTANESFVFNVSGWVGFRVRLSTVISGSGTVNVGLQASSLPPNAESINVGIVNAAVKVVSDTASAALADNQANLNFFPSSAAVNDPLAVGDWVYGGAFSGSASATKQGWSKARTSTVFNTASVAATTTGNSAVWTPATGNKFRLLAFQITAQGLAATATGVVTVSFQDGASGITFGTYDVDVPAVAGVTSGVDQISGWVAIGKFGILSAAANNVLNFNISAAGAGTVGTYRVNVAGTEE